MESRKETLARQARELRKFRKEHGLCVRCGKADPAPGITCCETCREKKNAQYRKYINGKPRKPRAYKPLSREAVIRKTAQARLRREAREMLGLCVVCGKVKSLPALKVCKDCRLRQNQYKSGYVEHSPAWYEKERRAGRL